MSHFAGLVKAHSGRGGTFFTGDIVLQEADDKDSARFKMVKKIRAMHGDLVYILPRHVFGPYDAASEAKSAAEDAKRQIANNQSGNGRVPRHTIPLISL
jgi:hypothetical protein